MTHPLLDFKNYLLFIQNIQVLIEPDIHLVGATMIPGIVRNQGELLVLDRNGAISSLVEHLRRGLDSLDRESWSTLGLSVLDAVVL